ncbi:Zinc phosphodiesterase ELAC protein 2 [Modicella reniformis]|uniref:ribonuclease Z n=1 Tax=Modicella reniformis TaxID=1440133 RepID=A0A9P6IL84_9FUNG|nr:Zinc phosphodiesterase ELAC protein 2 [Modicella reniformis]
MRAYVQILSTGTGDCPPSVAIHFDTQRYLINCGEGTQRLSLQNRFRFIKVKTILFTRTHWDCMGGAPGLLLTMADNGGSTIKLLGGENLTHAIASTRFFVYRESVVVETYEFRNGRNTYKDDNLRITAVQVYPENSKPIPPYEWPDINVPLQPAPPATEGDPQDPHELKKKILTTMFRGGESKGEHVVVPKKIKHDPCAKRVQSPLANTANTTHMTDVDIIAAGSLPVKSTKEAVSFPQLPRTSPDKAAISYIFQTPDYSGKFNVPAALALGVKKGRDFGELVRGNTVLSQSGETVYPHQVMNGARPGRVFMVVDCPTIEYLPSLVNAKEFEKFQALESATDKDSNKLKAACIVHLANHAVQSHPDYKAWMQRFGLEVEHIVANEDYCSQKLIWASQTQVCHKLSALDPTIFPLPYYDNTPTHDLAADLAGLSIKARAAETMLSYQLEPTTGWDDSEVVKPLKSFDDPDDFDEASGEMLPHLQEFYELAAKIKEETANGFEKFPGMDVVLTSLGTGSAHPSKHRNVSATLLDMPDNGTFLLDIGEGTYGQMFRQFGGYRRSAVQKDSVDARIERLKAIFISHLHADHHLGTVTIIDRWNKLRKNNSNPLYLIAPLAFNTFLRDLSDVFDFGYRNVQFINCEDILYHHSRQSQPLKPFIWNELLRSCGLRDIATVDVIHCKWAYGISLTHKDEWKIVYSGDTRPCNNLVRAGQGATVLLHEATFEDDKAELAVKKKHSTTQEAIMVGEGMGAKHTLLTHFSQRYPKTPLFDAENKKILNVPETATTDEIREAYKREALRTHPDRPLRCRTKRQVAGKLERARKEYDSARISHNKNLGTLGTLGTIGGVSKAHHAKANSVFGNVFEELLRVEVEDPTNYYSPIGMASGAALGFIREGLRF